MSFTILEPEVAGGWGDETVADTAVHPPIVSRLHYEFEGWLGDELLASFPCFIVSERVAAALEASRLTGFALDEVTISTSPEFEDLHPDVSLPRFRWLKVSGQAGVDDFGLAADFRLVVSAKGLGLLSRFTLKQADRTTHPGEGG